MKMRHDSLERKAYSYARSEIYGGSWVVMFRYKPDPKTVEFYGSKINQIGRAVVTDFYGKDLRVKHSDFPLRHPGARLGEP